MNAVDALKSQMVGAVVLDHANSALPFVEALFQLPHLSQGVAVAMVIAAVNELHRCCPEELKKELFDDLIGVAHKTYDFGKPVGRVDSIAE